MCIIKHRGRAESWILSLKEPKLCVCVCVCLEKVVRHFGQSEGDVPSGLSDELHLGFPGRESRDHRPTALRAA